MGYVFCLAAIGSTFWMARKSLGLGLAAVLAWGYIYGILRANLASGSSYFVFDASVVTLYITSFTRNKRSRRTGRSKALASWMLVLALWPALLILLPYQPIEISLVGFRGSAFFLPAAILGS